MRSFRDYNESMESVVEDELRRSHGDFYTTGLPPGFSELPRGYFVYMIIGSGKIKFVSHGRDPWDVMVRNKNRYKGDRILYRQVPIETAERVASDLIKRYHPVYNSDSRSTHLTELDDILHANTA